MFLCVVAFATTTLNAKMKTLTLTHIHTARLVLKSDRCRFVVLAWGASPQRSVIALVIRWIIPTKGSQNNRKSNRHGGVSLKSVLRLALTD